MERCTDRVYSCTYNNTSSHLILDNAESSTTHIIFNDSNISASDYSDNVETLPADDYYIEKRYRIIKEKRPNIGTSYTTGNSKVNTKASDKTPSKHAYASNTTDRTEAIKRKRKYENTNNNEAVLINIPLPLPHSSPVVLSFSQQQYQHANQLVNYSSTDVKQVDDKKSTEFSSLFPPFYDLSYLSVDSPSTETKESIRKKIKCKNIYNNKDELLNIPLPNENNQQKQKQKRNRKWKNRPCEYNKGKANPHGLIPNEQQIKEYEELKKETKCCFKCEKQVSLIHTKLYNNEIYCVNCLKKLNKNGEIDIDKLKDDYFERKNYEKEESEGKLFECKRSTHVRPAAYYIKKISGEYRFKTSCINCRNFTKVCNAKNKKNKDS